MEWEYLVFKVHKDLEKRECAFNFLGGENWELVALNNRVAYFKRPVPKIITTPRTPPDVCNLSDEARTTIKAHFKVDDDFVDNFEKMVTKARNEE